MDFDKNGKIDFNEFVGRLWLLDVRMLNKTSNLLMSLLFSVFENDEIVIFFNLNYYSSESN